MSEEQKEYKVTTVNDYKKNEELKFIEKQRLKITRKIKKLEHELNALRLWENDILSGIK